MAAVKKKPENGQVRILRLDEIFPSPENDQLYKPVSESDPAVIDLAESIRAAGFNGSITISLDKFILSGHRRRVAARLAGLSELPCTIENILRVMRDGSVNPEFVRRLEMYNRQRDKTLSERLREAVIKADPEDAHRVLSEYREAQATHFTRTIEMRGEKKRAEISRAKIPFANAAINILNSMRKYLPLSDRQIHYLLLNDPPLRHASKPDSTYQNDKHSYKDLTDLLLRLRLAGNIPMDWIADTTRPFVEASCYQNAGRFLQKEIDGFLKCFYRDLMQSQPNHIEIVGEKNTLLSIIKPVALNYCIPLTIGRGYASLPPRYEMAKRYKESGKEKFILLSLSDFDPDGEEITHSLARSLRDDFGVSKIECVKVALTAEQVKKYKLPPGGHVDDKKSAAMKRDRFRQQYGPDTYELEALHPDNLRQILDMAVCSVLDIDAYNHEVEREKEEAAFLDEQRQRVMLALQAS
jgi:hypothetical protein